MLNAQVIASIVATLTGAPDIGTTKHDFRLAPAFNFADGSGANQANKLFSDERTLAASATENIDLSGALSNALGTATVFTKVRALMIKASAANVNDVIVGGLDAAAFGVVTLFGEDPSSVKVKPGGVLLLVAPDANGYAVTAGTGDLLKIENSGAGTGVTYDIVVLGS